MCVNFIRERRDLQFNVDSERQIFWGTFSWQFYYSQSFCQKSAERKSPKKYFFFFLYFIFDDWPGIRTQAFVSNKPTHYILDHGDFWASNMAILLIKVATKMKMIFLRKDVSSFLQNRHHRSGLSIHYIQWRFVLNFMTQQNGISIARFGITYILNLNR